MSGQEVEDATYLVAQLLPACTQCGGYFSGSHACGIAHAIIAADPLRHRIFEPLLTARDQALRESISSVISDLPAVLDAHHHADDCGSLLSLSSEPDRECNCWKRDLRALIGRGEQP